MQISRKALEEFKAIYKTEFNEDLPDDIAKNKAAKLLSLMKVIYRPISKSNEK